MEKRLKINRKTVLAVAVKTLISKLYRQTKGDRRKPLTLIKSN